MNPRERVLAFATAASVLVALLWGLGLGDQIDAMLDGNSDTAAQKAAFARNMEAIGDVFDVHARYRGVTESTEVNGEKLRVELAFQEQVAGVCKDMGFEFPPIRAELNEIKDVDDYQLVTVAVKTEGTWENTVRLLKRFEAEGMLFRELELKSTRDRDLVVARATLGKIAEREKRPTGRRRPR